jgi:hypothetical protein
MRFMKSLLAAFVVLFAGCAQDFVTKPNDLAVKDFTPNDDAPAGTDDMGGASDGGNDLATPDLAKPDLLPPPDLTPVMCDLSMSSAADGSTQPRLYLAAVGPGNALGTASFEEGTGWSAVVVDGTHGVTDVNIAVGPGGHPLVVAHENDSGNTLGYTVPNPCTGLYAPLAALFTGAATSNRPSLVGGTTADILFRGATGGDNHLYHSSFDGTTWTAAPQLALLTDQWATAVRSGGVVHAIHTGTYTNAAVGGQLYDAPLGGTVAAMSTATSDQGTTAVVTSDGTIYSVFLGVDTNLYWMKLPSGGTWSSPAQLCAGLSSCLDASDKQPLMAVGSDGKPIAVWHGKGDSHLYTSTLTDGASPPWTPAIQATYMAEITNSLPGIATGIGSATVELVYIRSSDSALRHTRLTTTWSTPATVGTQAFSSTPALASSN